MTMFIQDDAVGTGSTGGVFADRAFFDLAIACNGNGGLGTVATAQANLAQVNYARTDPGAPATRIDALVNTNFNVNPANIDIIVLAVAEDFVFNDASSILTRGGTALPPAGSGQPGANLNASASCLAIYDTSSNNGSGYCVARDGTGALDLGIPIPVILFHELSHAFRIVGTGLLALGGGCDPSSPEENAAIIDENQLRDQMGLPRRDAGIHCGQTCAAPPPPEEDCCIVASIASRSPVSAEVVTLRRLRDRVLRRSEVVFDFFEHLHDSYYGVSPEVCRLMIREPRLREHILNLFVRPLVLGLGLIDAYTRGGMRGAELGAKCAELATGPGLEELGDAELNLTHALLRGTINGTGIVSENPMLRDLFELLENRARQDRFVYWALVEPADILLGVLVAARAGNSHEELGAHFARRVDDWGARMPLTGVWAALTTSERVRELAFLQQVLLVSPVARADFADRLRARYSADDALARALQDAGYSRKEA